MTAMSDFNFAATEVKIRAFAARAADLAGHRPIATMVSDPSAEIATANALFSEIGVVDLDWHDLMRDGVTPWSEAEYDRLGDLYGDWAEAGKLLLSAVESSGADGLDQLRTNLREVEGIMTPDDEFFVHPKFVELRDLAIEAAARGEAIEFEEMGD
jgi:hypothetical protein